MSPEETPVRTQHTATATPADAQSNRQDAILHPPRPTLREGHLPVGDGHAIYWETSGNPAGIPALFLHGGPGGACSPTTRRFFDAARYHLVQLDQRGCGRSTPFASREANTTAHLIADLERLREHLGIAQWLVFGGSWGSTLTLAYAQAHPERCLALVLRGVWLGSQAEIDWWLYGMRQFFPRAWDAFAGHVDAAERGDLLGVYLRRMNSPDAAVREAAAHAWAAYESACAFLHPRPAPPLAGDDARTALTLGLLEAHYFGQRAFLQPGQLLAGMPRIAHLPGHIVHGRYDVICPVRYAHDVAAAWPAARLHVVPDAGHASMEPGTAAALVAATDELAQRLSRI